MNRVVLTGLLLVGATFAGAAEGPNARVVLLPAKRLEALKTAARLLEPREPTWEQLVRDLPDPFFRSSAAPAKAEPEPVEVAPRSTLSDLEVLQAAAANIRPTGTMMVDGENYLLMDGKRYKRGAVLSLTIDGVAHPIVISAIEGKSYTLRLNEQELRQQLK